MWVQILHLALETQEGIMKIETIGDLKRALARYQNHLPIKATWESTSQEICGLAFDPTDGTVWLDADAGYAVDSILKKVKGAY